MVLEKNQGKATPCWSAKNDTYVDMIRPLLFTRFAPTVYGAMWRAGNLQAFRGTPACKSAQTKDVRK